MDAVARDTQAGLGGAAQVPGLGLQALGGAVAAQAVQAAAAAVEGLVQARQAPVRQPLLCGPESRGVSAAKKKSVSRRTRPRSGTGGRTTWWSAAGCPGSCCL